MSAKDFLSHFLSLMKKISLKQAYEIFPHFIRTVQNESIKLELDHEYVLSLKELPSKYNSLLSSCEKYGDLFFQLFK